MVAAGKKDRINRERFAPPPLDVFIERCPKCEAAPGERCTKRFSGKRVATAVPHEERVEYARKANRANWR